jgi:Fe-S-cluster containining protein
MKAPIDHNQEPDLGAGLELLRHPVLPLVSMVEFFYMTGPFASVAEVIAELPEPIETGFAEYAHPKKLLQGYGDCFTLLEQVQQGARVQTVLTVDGGCLDTRNAAAAICRQEILTRELERINSLLCGPCGCDLCCTGPDPEMDQEFFEIPLADMETRHFPAERYDSDASRTCRASDEQELVLEGQPFYRADAPRLIHWRDGWSLILPRETRCPNLDAVSGGCRIYPDRPEVCRRPQIFPYILEKTAPGEYRQRDTILASMDCPYVHRLQEDIAAYGAACELEVIFKQNKV